MIFHCGFLLEYPTALYNFKWTYCFLISSYCRYHDSCLRWYVLLLIAKNSWPGASESIHCKFARQRMTNICMCGCQHLGYRSIFRQCCNDQYRDSVTMGILQSFHFHLSDYHGHFGGVSAVRINSDGHIGNVDHVFCSRMLRLRSMSMCARARRLWWELRVWSGTYMKIEQQVKIVVSK
jgi:hypothetical protein